jgi:hypothetical protein
MLVMPRKFSPLHPLAGGEGRVRGARATAAEVPFGHLTLSLLRRGPLPLPRDMAERD